MQDQSFSAFLYGYPGLFLEMAITVLLYHDLEHFPDQYRKLSNRYALSSVARGGEGGAVRNV